MATTQLQCDGCGARRQSKPGVAIEDLRTALVEVGWYVDETQDLDLCPVPSCGPAYVERVLV